MQIKPYPDATDADIIGGLSSTVLRHIDFRAAREKWLELKANYLDAEGGLEKLEKVRGEHLKHILDRDGVTDEYLAHLAYTYVQLTRAGERNVSGKLAEMTGRTSDTMRQHLHRVRKAGMLTAIPGKAGGQLTRKAYEAARSFKEGPN